MLPKCVISYILPKLHHLSSMKELEQAHGFILKANLCNHIPIMAKLISFSSLSPSGSLLHAHALFLETTMDNSFICNTMIRAYSNSVFPLKSLFIYNHMQRTSVDSDYFTYNFVLKACAKAIKCSEKDADDPCVGHDVISRKGVEIHNRVLKLGFDRDHHVQNSLVLMYSRFGLVGFARLVFDEMPVRSAVSWNIMMSAYNRVHDYKSADVLLQLMPHANVISWNTVLARHITLNNLVLARKVFDEMPDRDVVSWNSIIAGYVKIKDYNTALELFHSMKQSAIEATEVTFISILGACAEMGALETGKKIHNSLKKKHYRIEGYLGNAIVDMYAKCGELTLALEVFNKLEMKPVSCWNAMIMGLAIHGHSEKALEMFDSMEAENEDYKPNRVTFIALLIACSHKGLVTEGRHFFNLMSIKYKIIPDLKHYGCMIDLFSRWGFLQEAYMMIKSCGFSSCSVLWRTLLGACRVYRDVELAEESFRELRNLEPWKDGDYVLLSNIYAEEQRWDDVERLRNEMIDYGVCKKAGSSSHVKIH